jgi:V/A-type H+-transporting ATPase subunit I
MLKPVEMRRVSILVQKEYLEEVLRDFGELGVLEIKTSESGKELGKYIASSTESDELKKASLFEKRVELLIDILGVTEKKDLFGAITPPKRTPVKNGNIEGQLKEVENFLDIMEGDAIKTSGRIEKLEGENSALIERKKTLLQYRENLKILDEFGGDVGWLGDSQFLYTVFGSLPKKDSETLLFVEEGLEKKFILRKGKEREERIPHFISVLREDKETLEKILGGLDWKRYAIPLSEIEDELEGIRTRLEDVGKETEKLRSELKNMRREYGGDLLVMKEIIGNGKSILELKSQSFNTENVHLLQGWIPAKRVKELEVCLKKATEGHFIFKSYGDQDKNAPTYLENPSFLKPFESLTSTFGLPNYNELDPTIFLAITFPLFYGIMFGDVGHGAILALLGVILAYLGKNSSGIKNLGMIIVICGTLSIVFGFMYGDIFGLPPYNPNHPEAIDQTDIFGFDLVEKLGPSPMHDPFNFLIIAVGVAVIHISLGLLIDLWNKVSDGKLLHAFASPFVKLWLYYGLIITLVFSTFSEGIDVLGVHIGNVIALVLLVVLPLVLVLFSDVIKHINEFNPKNLPAFLGEGSFEVFDTILLFLSNTISYSRLFALALVHAGLFMALFSISEIVLTIPVIGGFAWLLIVIIGTVIILALESIIVFLHSLRLHYYEWFSKFFGADGIPFKPFKIKRVYTYVKE